MAYSFSRRLPPSARHESGSLTRSKVMFRIIPYLILLCSVLVPGSIVGVGAEDKVPTLQLSTARERYALGRFAEILEDPERNRTIEEVASPALSNHFQPVGADTVNAGVTSSALWIRFTLHESEISGLTRDKQVRWLLDLGRSHYYDETLYIPVPDSGTDEWAVVKSCEYEPCPEGVRPRQRFFDLPADMAEPTTFYLRVQGYSSILMPLEVLTERAYLEKAGHWMFTYGLYYGLMAALILYNFSVLLYLNDRNYLYYILYQGFVVLYFLTLNDLTITTFLQFSVEALSRFCLCCLAVSLIWAAQFSRSFLITKENAPFWDRLLLGFMGFSGLIAVLTPFHSYGALLNYLSIMGAVAPILTIGAGIRAWKSGFRPARFFLLGWALLSLGALFFVLSFQNVLPLTTLGFHSFQVGSALEALLLSLALGDRVRTLKTTKEKLEQSAERLRTILDSVPSGIFIVDARTHRIVEANLAAAKTVGSSRDDLLGSLCTDFFCRAGKGQCPITDLHQIPEQSERELVNSRGDRIPIIKSAEIIEIEGREMIIESFVDISARKSAERRLEQHLNLTRAALDSTVNALIVLDERRNVIAANHRFFDIWHLPESWLTLSNPEERISRLSDQVTDPEQFIRRSEDLLSDLETEECGWIEMKDGRVIEYYALPYRMANRTIGRLFTYLDITARKKMEEELKRLAVTDSLTGIFNRRHFMELADHEFLRSRRYRSRFSVLLLDIDHFKNINDTYGHSAGDELLKSMARETRNALRTPDIFGRLGGEEFAVILPETEVGRAVEVAERLRKLLSKIRLHTLWGAAGATVSIGVASSGDEDDSVEDILKRADQAMYKAKAFGRDRVVSADPRGLSGR
jgi:diguanylate cyclase (GGDEF)-like protein/PAS domain S-box-containing protein